MWVVMSLHSGIGITTPKGDATMGLNWADGMIGALSVFDTKAKVDKYAAGTVAVMEAEEVMPEHVV